MRLEVLVAATNQLQRLERPSSENPRAMLVIGCKELRMLLSDPTFFSDLRAAQSSALADNAELRATLSDPGRFSAFSHHGTTGDARRGIRPGRVSAPYLNQQRRCVRC